jgi:hypothetical protein
MHDPSSEYDVQSAHEAAVKDDLLRRVSSKVSSEPWVVIMTLATPGLLRAAFRLAAGAQRKALHFGGVRLVFSGTVRKQGEAEVAFLLRLTFGMSSDCLGLRRFLNSGLLRLAFVPPL